MASGIMKSSGSTRRSNFSIWLGWQICVAGAAELSARSIRPRGGGLISRQGGGLGWVGAAAVVCEWLFCSAWAVSSRVMRRCNSTASGGTSWWRSQKAVLVDCTGRDGAMEVGAAASEFLQLWGCLLCVVRATRWPSILVIGALGDAAGAWCCGLLVFSRWRSVPSMLLP